MQPPIAGQVVLGWDPAFRTGCKLAVVDATGKVLDTTVVYPTAPTNEKKIAAAKATVKDLIHKYGVTLISVGNGTAIHYFMGGIRVDAQHRTGVQNLYAAGECCALYHGANRLGGNSLLGALYGGRVAAQTACAEAESASKRAVSIQPSNAVLPCEPQDKAELNRILLHALGVVRSGDTMQDALTQIAGMHGSLPLLGQAVLKSALARNESRGAHWRSDYPQRNDAEFHKTTAAYYDGQTVHISWDAVPERR